MILSEIILLNQFAKRLCPILNLTSGLLHCGHVNQIFFYPFYDFSCVKADLNDSESPSNVIDSNKIFTLAEPV